MPINFGSIQTTRGREYRTDNIAKINAALAYLPIQQRASIIGSIIEESGGNPLAKNETGAYQGLLQWGADRYQIQSDDPNVELNNQIQYIKETLNDTTDHKSWTDGGKGSGYKSFRDTYGGFTNPASDLDDVFRAFSFGYVRPQGKQDSFENRLKVVKQVYDRMKGDYPPLSTGHTEQPDATRVARPVLPVHMKGEGGPLDSPRQWDNLSLSEKSDIMREAVANGITSLREIGQAYNEYAEGGIMDEPEGTVAENQESAEAAKYNDGGHLFNGGGYKPSASIMRDIANWEGSSMETNRSFEAEARDFNRVIPRSVMSRLSQEQLDALYSYGYNVGMGNLKKRVLPTLTAYTQGRAGAEDVASSMWASRDKDLLGLRRRRAWERDMFTNQMSGRDLRSYRTSNALLSASIDEGIRKLNEAINAGSAYQDYTLPYPVPAPFNPTVYDDAWTVLGQDEPQQEVAEPVIVEEKRDPLALMQLVEEMTTPQAPSPLADYKPQATGYEGSGQGMYVPSFAPSHASMLDDSWFAEGGHLFDGTGESWLTTGVEMVSPEKLMFNPETGNVITDHTDHGVIVLPDVATTTKANGYGLKDGGGNYYNTSAGNYPRLVGDKVGDDINKVVLGSMALGTAPITLPEMAAAGVALSDGMMATRAGQGIGSMLANPYFNASMTALGAGDAYNTLSNEGLTYMNAPLTALELAPAYRLARPVYDAGKSAYRGIGELMYDYRLGLPSKGGTLFDKELSPTLSKHYNVQDAAEKGRQGFLNYVQSPWYKQRWLKQGYDENDVDRIINEMYYRAKHVPFDFSKSTKELGKGTYGITVANPRQITKAFDSMGNPVEFRNYNTGMKGINIASDASDANSTAFHELLHYTTNSAVGLNQDLSPSYQNLFSPVFYAYVSPQKGRILMSPRGNAWQNILINENETLLPMRDALYSEVWNNPQQVEQNLIKNTGYSPEKASELVKKVKDYTEYMWDIQEQRAHLQTWFADKVLPNIKNPNDANEIEQYFINNPDIIDKMSGNTKKVVTELRPAPLKEYAKYFAGALSSVPVIKAVNNEDSTRK